MLISEIPVTGAIDFLNPIIVKAIDQGGIVLGIVSGFLMACLLLWLVIELIKAVSNK